MLSVLQSFPAVLWHAFLAVGWLASCSCTCGAGQLAAAQLAQFNCHVDLIGCVNFNWGLMTYSVRTTPALRLGTSVTSLQPMVYFFGGFTGLKMLFISIGTL